MMFAPYSSMQLLAVQDLETYLVGFGRDSFPAGGVLCVLALLVWYATLVQEARDLMHVTLVCLGLIFTLPLKPNEYNEGLKNGVKRLLNSKPLRRQPIGIWKKYRRPATIALLLHQEV